MEEDGSTDRSEYTAALADQTFWILVDKQTWQYLRTVCPPPSWRCSVETLLLDTTLLSRQCNEIFLDEKILTLTLRQTHWWPRSILQTCGVDCSMKFEAGITREHRHTPPGHTTDLALWSRVGHAPMTQLTIPKQWPIRDQYSNIHISPWTSHRFTLHVFFTPASGLLTRDCVLIMETVSSVTGHLETVSVTVETLLHLPVTNWW